MTDAATQAATTTTATETVAAAAPTETVAATTTTDTVAAAATTDTVAATTTTEEAKKSPEQLLFGEEKKEGDAKPADGEPKKEGEEAKKEGEEAKPIEYKFFTPDGKTELTEEQVGDFKKFAETHKLAPEVAQATLNELFKYEEGRTAQVHEIFEGWKAETESDATYGGKNLQASINRANSVVHQFGDEEFKKDLQQFGLGNKLSLMRFLNKIGHAIGEDTTSTGGGAGASETKKDAADVLWGDTKK